MSYRAHAKHIAAREHVNGLSAERSTGVLIKF
jgi:hypothetical protein